MRTGINMADVLAIQERDAPDPAEMRALLARIPPSWRMIRQNRDGAMFRRSDIQVIVSMSRESDGQLWVHASACGRAGKNFVLPSWEGLKRVKHDFFGPHAETYQVFVPDCEWINIHPCVLHLFARFDGQRVLPDFTKGLGTL